MDGEGLVGPVVIFDPDLVLAMGIEGSLVAVIVVVVETKTEESCIIF